MSTDTIALTLFGGYYRRKRTDFSTLSNDLIKARIYVTVERWLSVATLCSLILSTVYVTFGLIVSALLLKYVPIWQFCFAKGEADIGLIRILAELGLTICVVLVCFYTVFLLFLLYPRVKGWERKAKIDGQLPYAICWMSFMAGTGVIPYMIFRKLAETEEFFGEVSQEAKMVVKDVELLGFDFISALRNLASATPSTQMRTFIQGAVTNSVSGGEMGTYFISKANEAMEENRRRFAEFIEALGMVSEVYIIAMVAAPLLVIIMFAAMMMLGGASPMILMAVIYVFIPLGSMGFVLLTDALTPEGTKG
ncbi:MAG: type II secretion system F family protein [Dehalococcoidia bacterium]|nr:type II secretion system F family protein [Dehalococcoidia bacterium]